jgi:hypothetical protein
MTFEPDSHMQHGISRPQPQRICHANRCAPIDKETMAVT